MSVLDTIMGLPLPLALPIPLLAALSLFYILISPKFSDLRAKSYLLSTVSASTMTLISLPFVHLYVTQGLQGVWVHGWDGWLGVVASAMPSFFGTYLFADLLVGYFAYPSQVGMLTGWIHHTVYIGIMIHVGMVGLSPVFLVGCFMEVPTLDLALSNLFPSIRSDERFLTLMFLTRILFNIYLLADCARPSSRAIMNNSWVPAIVLGLALAMHASWLQGGVRGYFRRRAKAAKATKAEKKSLLTDEVARDETLHVIDSGTLTPEESPLVTPRTPSQPFLTLRDGSLFPTVTIPTLANLPIPAIPTLSGMAAALPQAKANLNQLNFGFKEAVRGRWEGQREKWGEQWAASAHPGIAGRDIGGGRFSARAMGIHLENLGLRRRAPLDVDDDVYAETVAPAA